MAYDTELAQRIHTLMEATPGMTEKKMFGGVGYLLHGNMACGVHGQHLIVRLEPARYPQILQQPHVKPFDITGRPMTGWVMVEPPALQSDGELMAWLDEALAFARTLPPK